MSRRKISPLQCWRIEYAYVSRQIRQMKQTTRNGHVWGTFKVPRQQSLLHLLKHQARVLNKGRGLEALMSKALWEKNSRNWPENATKPEERL